MGGGAKAKDTQTHRHRHRRTQTHTHTDTDTDAHRHTHTLQDFDCLFCCFVVWLQRLKSHATRSRARRGNLGYSGVCVWHCIAASPTHTHICTHMHACMHTHMHAHIHTHVMHLLFPPGPISEQVRCPSLVAVLRSAATTTAVLCHAPQPQCIARGCAAHATRRWHTRTHADSRAHASPVALANARSAAGWIAIQQ